MSAALPDGRWESDPGVVRRVAETGTATGFHTPDHVTSGKMARDLWRAWARLSPSGEAAFPPIAGCGCKEEIAPVAVRETA